MGLACLVLQCTPSASTESCSKCLLNEWIVPVNDGVGSALNIAEKDFGFCSVGWKRDAFWPFIFFSSSFPCLPPGPGPGPDPPPSFS